MDAGTAAEERLSPRVVCNLIECVRSKSGGGGRRAGGQDVHCLSDNEEMESAGVPWLFQWRH